MQKLLILTTLEEEQATMRENATVSVAEKSRISC